MRLRGLLVAPLVLAGCSGRHASHAPRGVFEAQVTVGGVERTVWLDAAGSRLRVVTPSGRRRTVTVSDGRTALMRFHGFTTRTTGSAGFLVATADPAVGALRARLLGRSVPDTDTIAGLHRVRRPSAELFTVSAGAAPLTIVRQVRVGVAPKVGPRAYWLGGSFQGAAPDYASITTSEIGSSYTVAYPRIVIEVDSSPPAVPACGTTPVELADGTPARLTVGLNDLASCHDATGGIDFLMVGAETGASGGVALVDTPEGTVWLSGPAVSATTAAAVARALRPV
jgi:hypothetical protein